MSENSCSVEACCRSYFCRPQMPSSILLLETDRAPGPEGWNPCWNPVGLGEGLCSSFSGLLNGVTPPAPRLSAESLPLAKE